MKSAFLFVLLFVGPLIVPANTFGQLPKQTYVYKCDLSEDLLQLLGVAVSKNDVSCVRQILRKGVDPIAYYDGGPSNSPIVVATVSNYPRMIDALCEAGFNWGSEPAKLAVALAASNGRIIILERMLHAGMPVDLLGEDGQTPLMYASVASTTATVEFLLKNNADPNAKSLSGLTALMVASDDELKIKMLLQAGARINDTDNMGRTAVFYALKRSQPKKLKVLLQNKADVNTKDGEGVTPLEFARRLPKADPTQRMIAMLLHALAK